MHPHYTSYRLHFKGKIPRATALENAVAYVRSTMYDVRFINNVRVTQILELLTFPGVSGTIIMMIAGYHSF